MKKVYKILLTLISCCLCALFFIGCKKTEDKYYQVIFMQDNQALENKTYKVGTQPIEEDYPFIESKKGYSAYWDTVDFSSAKENDVFYVNVNYSAEKYTVSYDADGGNAITKTTQVVYDSPFTLEIAVKTGMTFEYWSYIDGNDLIKIYVTGDQWKIDKDVTLKAVYSSNIYSVSYDLNNTGTVSRPTTNVRFGLPYTLEVPESSDFVFSGWKDESGNDVAVSGPSWAYDRNVVLSAVWSNKEIEYYTLTFIQDGQENVVEKVQKGDAFSYERAPKITSTTPGYNAVWCIGNTDGEPVDFNNITSDLTLYVDYRVKKFTIIFDSNGGEAIARTEVTYGEEYELPTPVIDADLCCFWYKDDNHIVSSGIWYNDYDTDTITLTAHWKVMVTFIQNGKAPKYEYYEIGDSLNENNTPKPVNEADDEWFWTWKNLESYTNLTQNTTVYSQKSEKYWTDNK